MKNCPHFLCLLILGYLLQTNPGFCQYAESTFYVEGISVKSLRKTGDRNQPPVYRSAAYPGGMQALVQYLKDHADCNAMAENLAVEGKIMVSFLIEKDGSVSSSNFQSIHPDPNDERSDILSAMPRWIPAQVNGIPVKTKLKIPLDMGITDNWDGLEEH